MKAILLRSIWTAIIILILLILGTVVYNNFIGEKVGDFSIMLFQFVVVAPLGLPFLILIALSVMDGQIRKLSEGINVVEEKNRIMISFWVFALVASLPTLLLIGYLTIYFVESQNIGPGADAVIFVTLPCSTCSLFLILISGLIARRSVKRAKLNEKPK